jgi:hypothetical protein
VLVIKLICMASCFPLLTTVKVYSSLIPHTFSDYLIHTYSFPDCEEHFLMQYSIFVYLPREIVKSVCRQKLAL